MRGKYKFLTFLSNLNIGISAPVLSLMLCEHGCSLENIGLAIMAFSITVVVMEIPSGIFADLYGRKYSFVLSQVAGILSAGVLGISESFIMASIGLVLMGVSTAFASGSLDALAVEDTVKRSGEAAMSQAVSTLQVCVCAGVAGGAFLGGFLPYTDGYVVHLLLKVVLGFIATISAVRLPKERLQSSQKQALKTHINEIRNVFRDSTILKRLTVCIVVIACVQASVETYWQPQLAAIQIQKIHNILGILSAAAYLATVFGCCLTGRLKFDKDSRSWNIYFAAGCGILLSVVVLSLVTDTILFAIIYMAIYFLIGALSVAEQTIINHETEDGVRASVLSVTSFLARMGGALSGAVGSYILISGGIGDVWRILAAVSLVVILMNSIRTIKIRRND